MLVDDLECQDCRSTDITHTIGPNFVCDRCGTNIDLPDDFPIEDWIE
jgi:hypothetical protein